MVLRRMFGKMQQQAEQGSNAYSQPRNKRPDGSISIDYMPPQPKTGNADKLGDFVDYEEVK